MVNSQARKSVRGCGFCGGVPRRRERQATGRLIASLQVVALSERRASQQSHARGAWNEVYEPMSPEIAYNEDLPRIVPRGFAEDASGVFGSRNELSRGIRSSGRSATT
jgi:hypothetical protein